MWILGLVMDVKGVSQYVVTSVPAGKCRVVCERSSWHLEDEKGGYISLLSSCSHNVLSISFHFISFHFLSSQESVKSNPASLPKKKSNSTQHAPLHPPRRPPPRRPPPPHLRSNNHRTPHPPPHLPRPSHLHRPPHPQRHRPVRLPQPAVRRKPHPGAVPSFEPGGQRRVYGALGREGVLCWGLGW